MTKKATQGCLGCFSLVVLGTIVVALLAQCSPDKKQSKALLQECESQVKSKLPFPNTYDPVGIGAEKFMTLYADEQVEHVGWDFRYQAKKPDTIVGQAQNNPLAIATAICEINKKTGEVIGSRFTP